MSQQAICDAIRQKLVLTFRYDGVQRTVEPHTLGYDADGDLTLSGWQTAGTKPGWRDFHVSKLTGLATDGSTFAGPRKGYNPNDTTLSRILCRL